MSERIHAITDGTAGRVHAYLLEMDDGVTLIDTLSGDDGAAVLGRAGPDRPPPGRADRGSSSPTPTARTSAARPGCAG